MDQFDKAIATVSKSLEIGIMDFISKEEIKNAAAKLPDPDEVILDLFKTKARQLYDISPDFRDFVRNLAKVNIDDV